MEKRKNAVDQMHPKVDDMASIPLIAHEAIKYRIKRKYITAIVVTAAAALASNIIWIICIAAGIV